MKQLQASKSTKGGGHRTTVARLAAMVVVIKKEQPRQNKGNEGEQQTESEQGAYNKRKTADG